jgi:hypothetical protein
MTAEFTQGIAEVVADVTPVIAAVGAGALALIGIRMVWDIGLNMFRRLRA